MRPTFSSNMRSGREQKRAMQRSADRQRAGRRRERRADIPMIVKTDYVLAPVEAVLAQLELRGTVDVLPNGTPIFQAADGTWCPTADAIVGMADFFEMWATRHRASVDVSALRQIAARLEYGMPVDEYTPQCGQGCPARTAAHCRGDGSRGRREPDSRHTDQGRARQSVAGNPLKCSRRKTK